MSLSPPSLILTLSSTKSLLARPERHEPHEAPSCRIPSSRIPLTMLPAGVHEGNMPIVCVLLPQNAASPSLLKQGMLISLCGVFILCVQVLSVDDVCLFMRVCESKDPQMRKRDARERLHVHMHMHMHTHAHTHTHTCTQTRTPYTQKHAHAHARAHTQTQAHTHTHVHTCANLHTLPVSLSEVHTRTRITSKICLVKEFLC